MTGPRRLSTTQSQRDHGKQVIEKLLAVVPPDFIPTTTKSFRRSGVSSPGRRVAEDLGLADNAVMLGKSRIIERLMEEPGDFFW